MNSGIWIFIAVVALVLVGMFLQKSYTPFVLTGLETMTRTPSTTNLEPGETFTLEYQAIGATGTWGASIVDDVSGGCTFPGGVTEYKSVMLSADGNTKTVTINSPTADATCVFTGDYKFGAEVVKNFVDSSVVVLACNTNADTDCDGIVDRTELGVSISGWIAGTITRDALGEAIVAWVSSA